MNKRSMRRVCVLFFGLLCFLFVLANVAMAQEKPVTSARLSLNDAAAHVIKINEGKATFGGIKRIGIRHQKEGEAMLYYVLKNKNEPGDEGDGKILLFVKLDSGEWIDTATLRFVTK